MYVSLHNDTNSTTIYHFFFNFILATNKYQKRERESGKGLLAPQENNYT